MELKERYSKEMLKEAEEIKIMLGEKKQSLKLYCSCTILFSQAKNNKKL